MDYILKILYAFLAFIPPLSYYTDGKQHNKKQQTGIKSSSWDHFAWEGTQTYNLCCE